MSSLVIQTMNREFFSLDDVKPGETVASLKAKIQVMKSIPSTRQKLRVCNVYPRRWLADTYKLPPDFSTNGLDYQLQTYIDIEIRKMDGSSIGLRVECHEFIFKLKRLIAGSWPIHPGEQCLSLDQTETMLDNNTRLSQYNIQNNSILNLIRYTPTRTLEHSSR